MTIRILDYTYTVTTEFQWEIGLGTYYAISPKKTFSVLDESGVLNLSEAKKNNCHACHTLRET